MGLYYVIVAVYSKCIDLFNAFLFLQLIAMSDIKEVIPDFQKLTKMENCIVIHLKNDTKLAITSPVSYFNHFV